MTLTPIRLTPRQLKMAQNATARRLKHAQPKGRSLPERVTTFPARFDGLRDRLVERAKVTPDFLSSVFTLQADDVPTDSEILQSIENRVFDLTQRYPEWFAQTPDADAHAGHLRREHGIENGLIQRNPLSAAQMEAIQRRKQERAERDERLAERIKKAAEEDAAYMTEKHLTKESSV